MQPRVQQMPTRVAAPLRQQVVTLISEAIATGTYQPGERLIERDLCARYDVSRTVIREALRHLEAQGLIEIVPNRGPVVARVSAEEAAWLFEVRAALEALAGQCFTERATAADKDALTAAIEQVRRQMDVSDMATLLAAKDHFYDVLLDGSGNPIIASMLRTLHARIRLLRGLSLGAPGRLDDTLIELDAIRAAIMDGDGEGAARACRLHVQSAASVALPRLVDDSADAARMALDVVGRVADGQVRL